MCDRYPSTQSHLRDGLLHEAQEALALGLALQSGFAQRAAAASTNAAAVAAAGLGRPEAAAAPAAVPAGVHPLQQPQVLQAGPAWGQPSCCVNRVCMGYYFFGLECAHCSRRRICRAWGRRSAFQAASEGHLATL